MELPSLLRRVHARTWVLLFFLATLLLGLWVSKDYGISWDEKAMFVLGKRVFEYITLGAPYPDHPGIRFHGALLETILNALQRVFHLTYARHVFIFRHAAGFTVYWMGMVCMYFLALRTFRHRGWALLVALLYLLSPRQFGHSFINTRDIPAMVYFILKMITLLYFIEKKSFRSAILHGAAAGLVLALRVGGLFVPIYTVGFFAIEILREYLDGKKIPWLRYGLLFLTYGVVFAFSTVILWPLLWEHPLGNFIAAISNMLHSQQAPGGLYFGQMVGEVPWHWIPVHFVTKTPLIYVALFLIGCGILIKRAFIEPRTLLMRNRDPLLFFSWFLIPIIIVVVFGADLFDEWRHLYFIYPPVLLLSVFALREMTGWAAVREGPKTRKISLAAVWGIPAACFLSVLVWMVRSHPLEYVYFSVPSRYIEYNFELDYWGVAYRQAFEWVLEHDEDPQVTITVTSSPGWENLNMLTREQRKRIILSKKYTSKYVLDNFDWQQYRHTLPDETIVHSVMISGIQILNVYRNPFWEPEPIDPADIMEDEEVQLWFDKNSMM